MATIGQILTKVQRLAAASEKERWEAENLRRSEAVERALRPDNAIAYLACTHCGERFRDHVGPRKKCLFMETNFGWPI